MKTVCAQIKIHDVSLEMKHGKLIVPRFAFNENLKFCHEDLGFFVENEAWQYDCARLRFQLGMGVRNIEP